MHPLTGIRYLVLAFPANRVKLLLLKRSRACSFKVFGLMGPTPGKHVFAMQQQQTTTQQYDKKR
jgi:hypothetical protein